MSAKRTCSADGCDRPAHARGWCTKHYQQWRQRQLELQPGYRPPTTRCEECGQEKPPTATALQRCWAKVDTYGPVAREELGPCWVWLGAQNDVGYGSVRIDDRARLVHRLFYQALVGPIPAGLHLDHLCRVPWCVRPDHLEAVTPQVNVLRGQGPTAQRARQTHCIHGHEFTPENTYFRPSGEGKRNCKQCARDRREAARGARGITEREAS